MEKYRKTAEKKLTSKIHPDVLAQQALINARFASQEREYFFDHAYGEILVEYFINWLQTEPHETKTREFIYNSALALGDVKQKMLSYEMLGKNIQTMEDNDGKEN